MSKQIAIKTFDTPIIQGMAARMFVRTMTDIYDYIELQLDGQGRPSAAEDACAVSGRLYAGALSARGALAPMDVALGWAEERKNLYGSVVALEAGPEAARLETTVCAVRRAAGDLGRDLEKFCQGCHHYYQQAMAEIGLRLEIEDLAEGCVMTLSAGERLAKEEKA